MIPSSFFPLSSNSSISHNLIAHVPLFYCGCADAKCAAVITRVPSMQTYINVA